MKKIGITILLTAIIIGGRWPKVSAESQSGDKQSITGYTDEFTNVATQKDQSGSGEFDSTFNLRTGRSLD